jgi:hypothetical protein
MPTTGVKKEPKFRTGEIVRVKSKDTILAVIRPDNRLDGCLFTEQMGNYCGNEYPILRVVNSIFNEQRKRSFKTRSTLYILENLICEGKEDCFPVKCDHGCLLLWHEDWIEKT